MAGTRTVLITGMSGTGKSSLIRELAGRGHDAVDLDTPQWSHWVESDPRDELTPADGRDWVWRLDRIAALLCEPREGLLFVSGTASNMAELYDRIDLIVLLSAPAAVIVQRLSQRAAAQYGASAGEREKVLELIAMVEPMLRESADVEIDSSAPVAQTVDRVLRAIGDAFA